jgi:hypothetical protein
MRLQALSLGGGFLRNPAKKGGFPVILNLQKFWRRPALFERQIARPAPKHHVPHFS